MVSSDDVVRSCDDRDSERGIAAEKGKMRDSIKATRYVMPVDEQARKSLEIMNLLLSLDVLAVAKRVCCYVHKDATREVRTRAALDWALSRPGLELVVPVTRVGECRLDLSLVGSLDDLVPSTFGVLEPVPERLVPASSVDVFIVPCLAVDPRGNRLGYGMGYYDRLFVQVDAAVPRIALAFSFQLVDRVPVTSRDKAVTHVVTESGVLRCRP